MNFLLHSYNDTKFTKHVLLIVFLLSTSFIYSQEYMWEQMSYTIDSLPTNAKYLEVLLGATQKSKNTLLAAGRIGKQEGNYIVHRPIIYSSVDSGVTWTPYSTNFNADTGTLFQMFLLDSSRMFVNGIYRYVSQDTGRKWTRTSYSGDFPMPSVSFRGLTGVSSQNYVFDIYLTTDGGIHWSKCHERDTTKDWNNIFISEMVDSTTILVERVNLFTTTQSVGTTFYYTTNLGKTWQNLGCTVKGYEGDSSNNIYFERIQFLDNGKGIAFGVADYTSPTSGYLVCAVSNDAGRTWSITDRMEAVLDSTGTYNGVYVISQDTLILTMTKGQAKISYDGGNTWQWYIRTRPGYIRNNVWQPVQVIKAKFFFDSHTAIATADLVLNGMPIQYRLVPTKTTKVEPEETILHSKLDEVDLWIESSRPSPASTKLTIVFHQFDNTRTQKMYAEVFDVMGNRVMNISHNGLLLRPNGVGAGWYDTTINVEELPEGVYVLRLTDGMNSRSVKFVRGG